MDQEEYKGQGAARRHGPHGHGMRGGEKAQDMVGTWKKLLKYCRKYYAVMVIAILCAAAGTVLTLIGPDKLSEMTDCITEGIKPDTDTLEEIVETIGENVSENMKASGSSQMGFSAMPDNGAKGISEDEMQKMTENLPESVKEALYTEIEVQGVKISGSDQMALMDAFSRLSEDDTDTFLEAFDVLPESIYELVKPSIDMNKIVSIGMILMAFYVISYILSAVQGWIMATVTQRVSKEMRSQISHKINRLPMWFYNRTTTGDVLSRVTNDVDTIAQSLNMSVGTLVSAVVLLVGSLIMMLKTNGIMTLTAVLASLIGFVFMFAVKGYVEFDHVKFGYEGSGKTLIKDFSAIAKPGQKIAIVGPTGAGKTTMVNLLMRFHEIQSGEIRIDGVSTKNLTREDVHSQFCMVLQDTWLFEGTVRENLVYCAEGVTDEKVKNACKAVGLDHFIRTLPKGYDTVLNDQINLSQGQKQQLTIARAMIADKPMLIMDEATSSVDTRTEQKIQEAMDKLMENRTSFVIVHRLSTIKNSDLILVMRDGDIVESGNHEELLEKNGFYAELYNSQFELQTV